MDRAARLRAELAAAGAEPGGAVEDRLRTAILALTRHRGPDSSICPSDAARAVGGERWRELMAQARDVARDLARAGEVEITQRGRPLRPDGDWVGPVRIRRP